MANDYDETAKNVMLDALAALMTRVALHTGDPGGANSAANECTGGGYARQAVTWNPASGGSVDSLNVPVVPVAGGQTVTWASFWNTAGTVRYLKKAVTAEAFGANGNYTVNDADFDLNDP